MSALRRIDTNDETSIGVVKLAREAVYECDGDRDAALVLLRKWIDDDRALFERLIDPLIDDALANAIRRVATDDRSSLRLVAANPDKGAAGIVAMVERTLLDFPMPRGKRLGDATPAEVSEAAEYYRARERFNRQEARWYELVFEAMQGGSRVEAVLSHDALARLRRLAEEE